MGITKPEDFFGFRPGSNKNIARWDKIVEYYELIETQSERLRVVQLGPSTQGNAMLLLIVTSSENMENLEEIRRINLTLADPRGLSEKEIGDLVKKGKSVSLQAMSVHADEIGGTQMTINLIYTLLSEDSDDVKTILNESVSLFIPCRNPDGQIMMTDWYYQTLCTEYEGSIYPRLYHKYSGHDTGRDTIFQNTVEIGYLAKVAFHNWMPQVYQDVHQMRGYRARILIAPFKNPIRPYVDPLVWREANWYGANMAYDMEAQGLSGVQSGALFAAYGNLGSSSIAMNCHNITGLLTESATTKLATPKYIHPTQLYGGDNVQTEYLPQTNFTTPWPGGWWGPEDITKRQYAACFALILTMAKNRETILRNMAKKALSQTKRGAEDKIKAFVIPPEQHDCGSVNELIRVLRCQNIEMYSVMESFMDGIQKYPSGSLVIPLKQPKYALVKSLFSDGRYPDIHWTQDERGAVVANDSASDNITELMGLKVYESGVMPSFGLGKEEKVFYKSSVPTAQSKKGYFLSSRDNAAYAAVNRLLRDGEKVWRTDKATGYDFYTEASDTQLKVSTEGLAVRMACCTKVPKMVNQIKNLKTAVYQRFYEGNPDEGWTRFLLERYGFPFDTVMDQDIFDGKLSEYDVLILPSDDKTMLYGPPLRTFDDKLSVRLGLLEELGLIAGVPSEYRSGLGDKGFEAIRTFISQGGRLLAWGEASEVAIDICSLYVKNVVAGLPASEYMTGASTLKVHINKNDPIAYGMPEDGWILSRTSPVFEVTETFHGDHYISVVDFPEENILQSGILTGEKLIASHSALIKAKYGKGEIVLYGFQPQDRMQTYGLFKLVFNALY